MSNAAPEIGLLLEEDRCFTQAEFDLFAEISGDDNPIHVDPVFSGETRFGRTVAHGMLLYTSLWGLVHRHLPGFKPSLQSLMFPAPTFAGEAMELRAELVERQSDRECVFDFSIRRKADEVVTLQGRASLIRDEEDGA
ncbi:MaoC/PaaZ C-terminal domain-containing protein [Aestuariispira ectoiniformans]|uniref:MaoC/PaaZ C-terminal domain-containing protein n=1 Tax=Aestuariispira ectoiniformans TaxID=2775080 RepID=UPI00223B4A52|nr:MaoC/PaaZ C-terminal domain-containing protein [Aestuariispira ectoiniformans]